MRKLATVAVLSMLTGAGVRAQLNQNCTVCVLNRCVRANADGSWVLPNIPAGFGQVKARATCVQGGATTSGESAFFTLDANTAVNLPEIVIGTASPIPSSLSISPAVPVLSTPGQTLALTVTALFPSGSTANVTAGSSGTNYTSSNPAIASVDANGVLTAVTSGTVIVQANNDGATGMITARVSLSNTDSDNDGIPDDIEIANGLNPNNAIDAQEDFDRDDLTNAQEIARGTAIRNADSDADGLRDGDEITRGTNALDPDSDDDLIPDGVEVTTGSNPMDRQSFDLRAASSSSALTPSSFSLTTSTVNPDASIQLSWRVTLIDGKTTLDLTQDTRTTFSSDNLNVCSFSSVKGRVSAGSPGSCVITAALGNLTATANGSVSSFSPTEVSAISIQGAMAVDVSGNYAYVAAGAAGLVVVDIANRAQPVPKTTLGGLGTLAAVRIFGQYVLAADAGGFLRIIDVRNPLTPVLSNSLPIAGTPNSVAVRGAMAAITSGAGGVTLVNIAAPAAPSILSQIPDAAGARGADLSPVTGLLAVALGTGGLRLFDITNPAAPQPRGTIAGGDVRRVLLRLPGAILADAQRGYVVANVSNPASPTLGTPIPELFAGRPVDVVAAGGLSMTADISFGRAIPIISIADPLQPTPLAFWNLGAGAFSSSIAMDNTHGYLITPDTLRIGKYQDINDGFGVRPTVSLTAPASGAVLIQGQTITVAADASDDVAVRSVSFFVDGQPISTSFSQPYQTTFTVPATATGLRFGATAVDFGGNSGAAPDVNVQVIPDPLTTATGRVIDSNNSPVGGAAVSSLGRAGTTAADGTFSLTALPTIRGPVIVSAVATLAGVRQGGVSVPRDPIPGGTVAVGDIRLAPKPFVNSVSPTSILSGVTTAITVAGSNLGGSTFAFVPAGVTIGTATIAPGGTSATLQVTPTASATGLHTLIATNPAGASDAAPVLGFLLNPPPFNSISIPGPNAGDDPDKDGLTNAEEATAGTDPLNGDTDGDGWPDGLEVALSASPRSGTSVPNPSSGNRYANSFTISLLNQLNPGSGVPGSTQFVTGRVFSLLNSLNPSSGLPGSSQFVSGNVFSLLNNLNPSTGVSGSAQFVSSKVFSLLNNLNPSTELPGTSRYVSSRTFSLLNALNPAPVGPMSTQAVGPIFSISNGQSAIQMTIGPGGYRTAEAVDRIANPDKYRSELRMPVDSDGDGIPDEDEFSLGTNPTSLDTDGDGFPDGLEFVLGSHPLDPASRPEPRIYREVLSPAVSIQNGAGQSNQTPPAQPANLR